MPGSLAPRQRPSAAKPPPLSVLQASVSLQDHYSRLLRLPGHLTASASLGLSSVLASLSPEDWEEIRLQSLRRGDSRHECSICLQPFRAQAQTLLSCSHSFHTLCLANFERYAQARCCPLCRCEAYQKRKIADGARFWREACATRIQAAYRAYRARKQFSALRELVPPAHPGLRRRWVADKLQRRADKLVEVLEPAGGEIEALFAELDATVRQSKAVYCQLDARRPQDAAQRGIVSSVRSASAEQLQGAAGPTAAAAAAGRGAQGRDLQASDGAAPSSAPVDWAAVTGAFLARDGNPECPICLAPLARPLLPPQPPGEVMGTAEELEPAAAGGSRAVSRSMHSKQQASSGNQASRQQQSPGSSKGSDSSGGSGSRLAVLSCSHAFHCDCLSLFEAFQLASEAVPRCPCCRSEYARMVLS